MLFSGIAHKSRVEEEQRNRNIECMRAEVASVSEPTVKQGKHDSEVVQFNLEVGTPQRGARLFQVFWRDDLGSRQKHISVI